MKNGKNRIPTAVAVILLAAAIALTGVIVYAEYTKSSRTKRVIASYESSEVLFSSNYMALNTASAPDDVTNKRTVFVSAAGLSAAAGVTICNYAQGNPGRFYTESDIEYTLTAELVATENGKKRAFGGSDVTSGKTVTLSYNGENVTLNAANPSARSHTFSSSTLDRRGASIDVCSVQFSPAFNDDENNIYLYLKATPVGTYDGVLEIDGILTAAVANTASAVRWEGYFNEAGALGDNTAALPSELDGFNYVVSGYGATTVRLKWQTSAVVPSQVFTLGKTIRTDGIWSYVDFAVDSDVQNRYDIQFYRADGTSSSFAAWNTVKGYVDFESGVS